MNIEKLIDAGVTYLNALTELAQARTAGVLEDNKYAAKWHAEDPVHTSEEFVPVPVPAIQEPKADIKKVAAKEAKEADRAAKLAAYEADAAKARALDEAEAAVGVQSKGFEAAAIEAAAADPIDYDKQVAPVLQRKAMTQRAAVIALLAEFGVKNGKALQSEQYADFLAKLNDDEYLDSLI